MTLGRREFLLAGLASGGALGLGGCAGLTDPLQPVCGNDPSISDPNSPLTIDVHSHVFNGSDLQVNGFLSRVLRVPGIGPILQGLAWSDAPDAAKELSELAKVSSALQTCDVKSFEAILNGHREQQYQIGRANLLASVQRMRANRFVQNASTADLVRQINALPPDYSSYQMRQKRTRLAARRLGITIGGAIDFILRNFQFRYVNVFDYLREYSSGKVRRVDLMVAHLVDYDLPIGDGNPTHSSLSDQVRVMSRISALTSGRIHCYAPFDPFKQIAYELGQYPYSPMELLSDAILNRGFIGVKMYPPMGFQPYGNSVRPASFWADGYLPKSVLLPDLGTRLDRVLGSLYQWCVDNDVPIMAHSAATNSPTKHADQLTDSQWWGLALKNFPNLRLNLGHFGDTDEVTHGTQHALTFAALMQPTGPGVNVFADSAYFADVVKQPDKLYPDIKTLVADTSGKGDAALARRLMYGTDWEMIIIEGSSTSSYLTNFESLFNKLEHDPSLGRPGGLSDQFFGRNAANYLGLRRGEKTRLRLEEFYTKNSVRNSALLAKVDRTQTIASSQ